MEDRLVIEQTEMTALKLLQLKPEPNMSCQICQQTRNEHSHTGQVMSYRRAENLKS